MKRWVYECARMCILLTISFITWGCNSVVAASEPIYQEEVIFEPIEPVIEVQEIEVIPEPIIGTENIVEVQVEEIAAVPVYDESDLRLMASIIWAEAGNQCEAGQQAVGIIVMNRVQREDAFANTIYEVLHQKNQFSPISNGSFNTALNMYDSGDLPQSCIEAAKYALDDNKVVNYNGQDIDLSDYYFFSRYVANARVTIQDHDFK